MRSIRNHRGRRIRRSICEEELLPFTSVTPARGQPGNPFLIVPAIPTMRQQAPCAFNPDQGSLHNFFRYLRLIKLRLSLIV
jgi:hypothetical protein